jgi:hypothetical protein
MWGSRVAKDTALGYVTNHIARSTNPILLIIVHGPNPVVWENGEGPNETDSYAKLPQTRRAKQHSLPKRNRSLQGECLTSDAGVPSTNHCRFQLSPYLTFPFLTATTGQKLWQHRTRQPDRDGAAAVTSLYYVFLQRRSTDLFHRSID